VWENLQGRGKGYGRDNTRSGARGGHPAWVTREAYSSLAAFNFRRGKKEEWLRTTAKLVQGGPQHSSRGLKEIKTFDFGGRGGLGRGVASRQVQVRGGVVGAMLWFLRRGKIRYGSR